MEFRIRGLGLHQRFYIIRIYIILVYTIRVYIKDLHQYIITFRVYIITFTPIIRCRSCCSPCFLAAAAATLITMLTTTYKHFMMGLLQQM